MRPYDPQFSAVLPARLYYESLKFELDTTRRPARLAYRRVDVVLVGELGRPLERLEGAFDVVDSQPGSCDQTAHKAKRVTKTDTRPTRNHSFYDTSLMQRLFGWLAPWDKKDYPGKKRIRLGLCPGYSNSAIYSWVTGRRRPPLAMLKHWLCVLRAQDERLADLRSDIVDEIARLENRPKRVAHFEAIRRKRLERPREL